jgi:hypothetical protein
MSKTVLLMFTVFALFTLSSAFAQSNAKVSSTSQDEKTAVAPKKVSEMRTVVRTAHPKALNQATEDSKTTVKDKSARGAANESAVQNQQQNLTARDQKKMSQMKAAKTQAAKKSRATQRDAKSSAKPAKTNPSTKSRR